MNRIEEVPHIRSLFRQLDDAGKMGLVTRLRDIAIKYLQPVTAKGPRVFSEAVTAAYHAKGISLEWNLTIPSQAYAFYLAARNSGLSLSQQNAASLLYGCTKALEANALSDLVAQNILDTYGGLDLDAVDKAKKFTGKSRGLDDLSGVLLEILTRIGKKVSAKTVLNELQKISNFNHAVIQEVDDSTIYWRSNIGTDKTTKITSLNNRLTELRKSI